jgi:hypothetical protein
MPIGRKKPPANLWLMRALRGSKLAEIRADEHCQLRMNGNDGA